MQSITFSKKRPVFMPTTEAQHQKAYMEWAQIYGILPFIIVSVSAGLRNRSTGGHLKAQGWQAGIPDWFLVIPNKNYHGLFIELKRPNPHSSKLTPAQAAFLRRLEANKYAARIAHGWEEAKEITINYLKG